MRKLFLLFIALATSYLSFGQVVVTGSVGVDATYTSLTNAGGAFLAINGSTQTGANIVITITGDVATEAGTNSLNAGAWTTLTINPSGVRTISGTVAAPLIIFNGADNVTINGLNDGLNSLVISNTNSGATSTTSTIRFLADATNNTITNCSILGSATVPLGTNGGNIFISTGTTSGNDNITISNCLIGPAGTNLPSKGIYGNGSTTNSTIANSNVTITNCEIYDYFLAGGCAGIYVLTGNTDWNITNNKIYQTASRAMTSTMNGIYFSNSTFGNNIQITGNTIGYANNAGTGVLSLTSTGSFQGIYFVAQSTAANACNINSNVISDISLTSSTGTFTGINNSSTASSNTININYNSVRNIATITTTGTIYGINTGGATTLSASNNTINNISRTGSGQLHGIGIGTGTNCTISNNIITNLANNSVTSSSSFSGITTPGSPANITVNGNTISNLSTLSTATITIRGIYDNISGAGNKVFQNNIINNLSAAGSATLIGIYTSTTSTPNPINISGNAIYNFTGGLNEYGVQQAASSTDAKIFNNNIYDLLSTNVNAAINGIYNTSGTTISIYNNYLSDFRVSVATGLNAVNGLSVISGTTINIFNNTIYITGTSSGSGFGSSGIYATTTPTTVDFRNNIVVNNCVPTGTGLTVAYRRNGLITNYSANSNANCWYAGTPSAFNLIFYDGTNMDQDLAAFKTRMATRDQASISELPVFVNIASSPYNLHLNSGSNGCESAGMQITSPITITDDYDGDIRNETTPDIGADEADYVAPTVAFLPLDASTGVAVSVSITLTFNEAVKKSPNTVLDDSNAASVVTLTDGTLNPVAFTATYNAGTKVLTITPNDVLLGTTQYIATVSGIKDLFDNDIVAPLSASFTTGTADLTAPLFVSAQVENATPSDVQITFDEPVKYTDFSGFSVMVDALPATISGISGTMSSTISLTLSIPVATHQVVTFSYTVGNVTDIAGNFLADITSQTVVNNVKSSAKDITAFSFVAPAVTGIINGLNITVFVSSTTDVTALIPTITISDYATVNPMSGVAQNFTNPVTYTVTAEDLTAKVYTVTVNKVFSLPYSQNFEATWTVPSTLTNWSGDGIAATEWHRNDYVTGWSYSTGGSYSPVGANSSLSSARFHSYGISNGITTSLFSPILDLSQVGNKIIEFYTINPTGTDVLKVYLSEDGGSTYGAALGTYSMSASWTKRTLTLTSLSPNAKIKFSSTSDFMDDDIGLDEVLVRMGSSAKDITTFNITSPVATGTINGTNISLTVPAGTDKSALVSSISVSDASTVSPLSGIAHDFSTPATYTVTAEDGSTQDYTITVSVTAPIVEIVPANGITGVATDVHPTFTFDAAVRNIDNSAIDDINVDGLITFKTPDAGGTNVLFDAIISLDKKVITVVPNSLLALGTDYYISIDATVEDINDMPIAPANVTFTTTQLVDWCNLQWPSATAFPNTVNSETIYFQVFAAGITNGIGQGAGIQAWLGYNSSNTDPATWTNWIPATYNVDASNNDEYKAVLPSGLAEGTYYYASRFQLGTGVYSFGGLNDNFWNLSTNPSGIATVTDAIAPIVISASVENTASSDLVVNFSENVSVTDASGFNIYIDSNPVVINSVSGTGTSVLTFNIAIPVISHQVITYSYDGFGNIKDLSIAQNPLQVFSFLDHIATNNVLSSSKDILTFGIQTPFVNGTINGTNVFVYVPFGTNLTALVSDFTVSDYATVYVGTTQQISGSTVNNFTSPVTFTVHAEDATSKDYTVSVKVVYGLPYIQDFEGTPANWTINNPDAGKTWQITTAGGNAPGTMAAYVNFYSYSPGSGQLDDLYSPIFNLTNHTPVLIFKVAYTPYNVATNESDTLRIYASTDGGLTFNPTPIYSKGGADLATIPLVTNSPAFNPTSANQWRAETIDLTSFISGTVVFKFVSKNGYGNNLFVDDIAVFDPPTASISGTATICNGQSTDLSITLTGTGPWSVTSTDGTTPSTFAVTTSPHVFSVNPTTATTYSLTAVSDIYGAGTVSGSAVISINELPTVSTTIVNVACNGTNNGSATAITGGGTSPYDYLWDNIPASVSETANSLTVGTFIVTVSDANNCTTTAIATVVKDVICDTKVCATDCGSTATTLSKYIYCDAISNASDYEWEFVNVASSFSFTRTRGSSNTGFYLTWITGVKYGVTYDVRVKAKVGTQWGNFRTVCQITTPAVPTTKVNSTYCGTTVTSLSQYIYCDVVAFATDYEWEFVNAASSFSFTRLRGSAGNNMPLNTITGLEYGKTYDVRVRVQVGTDWSAFGTVCTITTPSIPTTQLQSIFSGTTIASLSNYFYCDEVLGATEYQWEITNAATSFSATVLRNGNNLSFSYVTGAKFSTTYDVRVKAKIGTQWGEYTVTARQISTPALATKVRADYCGVTAASLTQYVYCDAVKGAQDYEWSFVNTASSFSFTKVRGSANTAMYLTWITGIANNTVYDVSVKVKVNGEWGSFGTICQITTPSAAKLQGQDANEESKLEVRGSNLDALTSNLQLSLYPNPVRKNSPFVIALKADTDLNGTVANIYNMIGQIVYTQKISTDANEYLMNIEQNNKFTSGLFIIQMEKNGIVKRMKLIVE